MHILNDNLIFWTVIVMFFVIIIVWEDKFLFLVLSGCILVALCFLGFCTGSILVKKRIKLLNAYCISLKLISNA